MSSFTDFFSWLDIVACQDIWRRRTEYMDENFFMTFLKRIDVSIFFTLFTSFDNLGANSDYMQHVLMKTMKIYTSNTSISTKE